MSQTGNAIFTKIILFIYFLLTSCCFIYCHSFVRANSLPQQQLLSEVTVIQTAQNTNDRLTKIASLQWQKGSINTTIPLIQLNPKKRYQSIIGFGCALTEASSFVFSQLNEENKEKILEAYFSPTKGLNYTIGRIHMNSCDFTLGTYSCDNVENDFQLNYFNIERDKLFIVPFVKRALEMVKKNGNGKTLNLFLSPWSPPAWMKRNFHMNGSDKPIGLINETLILNSWALFYSKFISFYKKEGINFWGLTVQNEPEYAAPYESCVYTAEFQRDFIKNYLGPRIQKDHPQTKIMIYDHNRDHVHIWAKTIYSDKEAAKYISGTAFIDLAHQVDPTKFLLASEATQGPNVVLGDWSRGESYGYDIINDLEHWASGWVDWNCLLNLQGGPTHMENWCDSLIVGDVTNQTIYFNPMYYYFGHFTKYILQNSFRIGQTKQFVKNNEELLVTSFITPENNIVTVLMNQESTLQKIQLQDQSADSDIYLEVILPPHSIKTLIYKSNVKY
ncbi:hypothetical protein ABK040_013181 [Willaertia magna]